MATKSHEQNVDSVPLDTNGGAVSNPACIRGRVQQILIAFSLMTIPMIVFSCLLLGLVFQFRVMHNGFLSPNLKVNTNSTDTSVIYVRISATSLTTVASWSSTLAPILIGSAITLVSFPVAREILNASQSATMKELPTPFQLSLLLQMVANGSPSSLWHCTKYLLCWRGRRESLARPLKSMTWVLALGILLSIFVFVADTWFHFTTKAANFVQTSPYMAPSNQSFALVPECTNVSTSIPLGCTIYWAWASTDTFIIGPDAVMKALANDSETAIMKTYMANNQNVAYIGNPPGQPIDSLDYTAYTFGVWTQCKTVTTQCDLQTLFGAEFSYNCPFNFQGSLIPESTNTMAMSYFTDSTATNNVTDKVTLPNPYTFAALFNVNQNTGVPEWMAGDPEVGVALHGASIFIFQCEAAVYDVEYTSVNNTITRFVAKPSNSSTVNIIQGSQQYSKIGDPILIQAVSTATWVSQSMPEVAGRFALAYSQTALSVAMGAFSPKPAIELQVRTSMLVARVPKAALACLIIANLSFVVLGFVLAAIAAFVAHGDVGEVQARLSIPAIVAYLFEGNGSERGVKDVEELYEENKGIKGSRVRVTSSLEGGWKFVLRHRS